MSSFLGAGCESTLRIRDMEGLRSDILHLNPRHHRHHPSSPVGPDRPPHAALWALIVPELSIDAVGSQQLRMRAALDRLGRLISRLISSISTTDVRRWVEEDHGSTRRDP